MWWSASRARPVPTRSGPFRRIKLRSPGEFVRETPKEPEFILLNGGGEKSSEGGTRTRDTTIMSRVL
jgi:hypothetical protein